MNQFPGRDPENSWVIDDDDGNDDEEELTKIDAEVYAISQSLRELRYAPTHPVIELDDDEDTIVEEETRIENEIFDLTRDDDSGANSPVTRRNHDISSVGHRLLKITWNGWTLSEGSVVQINPLAKHPLRYKYLKITAIYRPTGSHRARDTLVRGTPYVKSMHLGGLLKWRPREVAAVYDVDRDDPRDPEVQAQIEVQITEVTGSMRVLATTNAPYPEHNEVGVLVCRWKYVRYWPNGKRREAGCTSIHPDYEASMVYITPEEADTPFKFSRETLRRDWRGETAKGGSYRLIGGGSPTAPIDLDDPVIPPNRRTSRPRVQLPGQRYTFFDAFSGAGGASRGAMKAGLRPRFAVDHWEPACRSYRRNFPTTHLFEMNVADFIISRVDIKADVLHLSPPCQVFSPAHTIPSDAKDAANLAALFGCEVVLRRAKPRIFTLEQTFGLMMDRFTPYFNHLVSTFTVHGYSVRWRVVPLANWGLPALRKRLIMIGAGPGESLPPFPPASHSEVGGGGTRPHVTARRAIDKIRARRGVDPLHNPRAVKRLNRPPWDADRILPRCITTSGGQNYHFSGVRELTLRELASLQGFPAYHAFEGPYVKKQIGNAFPPVVAEHLFRHVQDWLLKDDGMVVAKTEVAPGDGLVIVDESEVVPEAMIVEDDSENEDVLLLFEGCGVLEIGDMDVDYDSDRTLGRPRSWGTGREVLVVD